MYSIRVSPTNLESSPASPLSASFGFDFDDDVDDASDVDWLNEESMDAAEHIDDFTNLFLKPTVSNGSSGGGLAMKDYVPFPSPKSLTTTSSFGLTLEDVVADALLVERALPFLQPQTLSTTTSTLLPTGTSKLALSVPNIPTHPQASSNQQYISRVVPNAPGQYILSQVPSGSVITVARPQPKRKRNSSSSKGDESYPTDGKLLKLILDGCVNKTSYRVPSLTNKSAEQLMLVRNNRALARNKLTLKQIRSRENKFNGHYPDRKKVASSRKRVGGRFVKENKAVFTPAQNGV